MLYVVCDSVYCVVGFVGLHNGDRCAENEATPISYSTSSSLASDDDGSALEVAKEGMKNFAKSLSLSLEAEESGSNGEVEMPEL